MKERYINKISYKGQAAIFFPEFAPPTRKRYKDKHGKLISRQNLIKSLEDELKSVQEREKAIVAELAALKE